MSNASDIIVTRTPLRISFGGGGTDLPEFYRAEPGMVVSTAIDKYIYVTVKRLEPVFNERYRLNYSITEVVNEIDEIENGVARECLRLAPVEGPLYIGTFADLPASSGLGSSSSFAVGLLKALHLMRGERIANGQLADEASRVEIEMLRKPIGKQDQYAAAFGGLNCMEFRRDDSVSIEPLPVAPETICSLFAHLRLFWTGITRDSACVLDEQRRNVAARMDTLREMRDQARTLREAMKNGFQVADLGAQLDANWRRKRSLASTISDDRIDTWYATARTAGALGGKICGAGGGGFMLLLVPPERLADVRRALDGLQEIVVNYEPHGSLQILPHVA